jgi:O-succinylbenzoic acid--CoA ligase
MGFKFNIVMNEKIKLNGLVFGMNELEQLYFPNEPDNSWQNAIYFFLKSWFDDTYFITAHTSGSTGKPKQIELSKKCMIHSAQMTNRFFNLNDQCTALLCLPVSYIAGKMMLVRALVGGFNLICVDPKANPFENLNESIDFTAITPYQLHHSIASLTKLHIRHIIVGGGQVNTKLEQLVEPLVSRFYETYGMTETCSHIALRCFNGETKSDYFSIVDGVRIRQDERGCLIVSAPDLLKDEIITNDIVEIHSKTAFRWLGRADNMINSGGVKVHPELVEKKMQPYILHPFFIGTLPDENLGQQVVLVIESSPYTEPEESEVKNALKQVLGKYEQPKQIFYLSHFIYSTSNKVLRNETLIKAVGN